MLKKSIKILREFSKKPLTINEAVEITGATKQAIYNVIEHARLEGVRIQRMGHTPYMHFYIAPEDMRKVKCTMKDDIIDILKNGDAWTYRELAKVMDRDVHQIRRAVKSIIDKKEIELNRRQVFIDGFWLTQFQYKYAEEPCF